MTEEKRTWVVVADASRARIFEHDTVGAWELVEEFDHPEGRAHARDVVSDQQGRVRQIGTSGSAAGMAPHTDPADVSAERFARQLAERIEKARHDRTYERLVLVAPPRFLGQLEGVMGKESTKGIVRKVSKDLTHHSPEQVREHLAD